MAGGPAFADGDREEVPVGTETDEEQFGGLDSGDIDLLDEVGFATCVNDVNVALVVVDILSLCARTAPASARRSATTAPVTEG